MSPKEIAERILTPGNDYNDNVFILARAYLELEDKYAELISYLPKVPTQPYEKQLAEEITKLKEELERVKNGK